MCSYKQLFGRGKYSSGAFLYLGDLLPTGDLDLEIERPRDLDLDADRLDLETDLSLGGVL